MRLAWEVALGFLPSVKPELRPHFLTAVLWTTLLGFIPLTGSAQTWGSAPVSYDWNTAADWSPSTVPNGSSATATFGASSVTLLTSNNAYVSLAGMQFNSGAPSYAITINGGFFAFQGAGVADSSGATQELINNGYAVFGESSSTTATSAGDLVISGSGSTTFTGHSTAGQASITNQAVLDFDTHATAGNSSIQNNGGLVLFINNASAGQADLDNSGSVSFGDLASAGSATLVNNGNMNFAVSATGGNAVVTNNANLAFGVSAIAGNALIENNPTGTVNFNDESSASSATITNQGSMYFNNNSSAVSAVIFNSHILDFYSTAANAQIANSGFLNFNPSSTAGTATIATNDGGKTVFFQGASGGNAQFTTYSGGVFDASGVTIGTLNMGSYTQLSGGTLKITLNGGSPALLNASGGVTLGGTLDLVYGSGFSMPEGSSVTLFSSSGVSGDFDQWDNPQGGRLFPFYQPSQVYLESVLPTFQVGGLTPNQKAIAQVLDGAFEDVNRYNLMADLVGATVTALPVIYSQMDPSCVTSLYQMGFRTAHSQADLAFERLAEQVEVPGLTSLETQKVEEVRFAADIPATEEAGMARNIAHEDDWDVSLSTYGDFGALSGDGNAAGYKLTLGGLDACMDYRLGKDWTAGLLLGYSVGTANPDGGGELDANGGQAGLFAGWHDQGFHVEAVAVAGLNQYKIQRAGYGGMASGNTAGQQYMGRLGFGYDFRLEDLKVGPFASAEYTYVGMNGFNESGSNAPLEFLGQGETEELSDLGFAVGEPFQWDAVVLKPGLTAAWEHIYQGSQDSLNADLGSPSESFTVQGPATGQDALVLGVRLDAAFKGGWKVYGDYSGRIGMTNYSDQNLGAGVRMEF